MTPAQVQSSSAPYKSAIAPDEESLALVDVELIKYGMNYIHLRCGSCGHEYQVHIDRVTIPNWFACPAPCHKQHRFSV